MLQEHPQLCYALLHAQLIHGLTAEPSMPPDEDEIQQLRAKAARRHPPLGLAGSAPSIISPGLGTPSVVPAMVPGMLPLAGAGTLRSSPIPGLTLPGTSGLLAK